MCHTIKSLKAEQIMKFCLMYHINPTFWQQTNYCFFKHLNFSREKGGCRKCFPKVCSTPKHRFYAIEINKLVLTGKNVLIVVVPILINKHVFEPTYDIKFMVWSWFLLSKASRLANSVHSLPLLPRPTWTPFEHCSSVLFPNCHGDSSDRLHTYDRVVLCAFSV